MATIEHKYSIGDTVIIKEFVYVPEEKKCRLCLGTGTILTKTGDITCPTCRGKKTFPVTTYGRGTRKEVAKEGEITSVTVNIFSKALPLIRYGVDYVGGFHEDDIFDTIEEAEATIIDTPVSTPTTYYNNYRSSGYEDDDDGEYGSYRYFPLATKDEKVTIDIEGIRLLPDQSVKDKDTVRQIGIHIGQTNEIELAEKIHPDMLHAKLFWGTPSVYNTFPE